MNPKFIFRSVSETEFSDHPLVLGFELILIFFVSGVGLVQLLAVSNVLLKSVCIQVESISLCQTTTPTASQFNTHTASQPGPRTVILRCQKDGMLPQAIQAVTSLVSLALYAYATAVLGGMMMFPASDAVRGMVMFAVNTGLGRIIGSYAISQDHYWRTTVVVDVVRWQIDELRAFVKEEVRNTTPGSRP